MVNRGEDPTEATRREVLEETGWEPGPLKLLCSYGADVGISDARFHLYQADGASWQGPPGRHHRGNPGGVDSPQRGPRPA
jgi:8-oxo-dGDP phosphatase